jgi:integrase
MASLRKRNGRWQAQIRRAGQTPISRTFPSRVEARRWTVAQEAKLASAAPINATVCRNLTLGDLAKRYAAEVSPKKKGGEIEQIRLTCLARDPLASVLIRRLNSTDVAEFRDRRLKMVAGETVRRELALLHSLLEVAKAEWGISLLANPASSVKKPAPSPARERRLDRDEILRLESAALACRNRTIRDLVAFATETAMRRSELLSLHWTNIDLEEGIARLGRGKNGHSRNVPLSPAAKKILGQRSQHNKGDGPIFPLTPNAVRQAWQRLTRRAGITNLHFHDLRHEAISRFFERGLSIAEVALISGHRDVRMLFRYTHLRAEDVAKKLL